MIWPPICALWLGLFAADLFGQAAGPQDFGDAPTPYPTMRTNNGAVHGILQGFQLGARIDGEADGQPEANALGDDLASLPGVPPANDEDGVSFGALTPGQPATVLVVASQTGSLDAWIDFSADGSWASASDQIFTNRTLAAGTNALSFTVPAGAHSGFAFARFRLSKKGGLSFVGPAPDGEVEDYRVQILQPQESADVLITKRGTPNPVSVGSSLSYTLIVQNNGPASAINVKVIDVLPPNVNYISASSSQGICTYSGGTLTCAVGNMGAGTVSTITIMVTPSSSVLLTNSACVSSANSDPKPENNCSTILTEVTPVVSSCELSCEGRDFWLTFPGNYAPDPGNPVTPKLCLSGPSGTVVTVAVPGLSPSFSLTVTIPASLFVNVNLPSGADLGNSNDAIENKGVHVVATAPVTIHALSKVTFTSDGYLALPSNVLGTEHFVLAYGNKHTNVPELNGSQFAIVARDANTTVTIVPSVATGSRAVGVPFSILLGTGQTYQLRTTTGAPADLTGTHVLSDKPIAVFGSHACANINSDDAFYCDYVVEQLLPVNLWAAEFYTRPLATRFRGDTIRVLAAANNTIVSTNGTVASTLSAGGFFETILTNATQITSTRPVLVAQFANSSGYDSVTNSDPFMSLVPGRAQFSSQQRFCVPTSGFGTNHINVIAPSAAVGSVMLDALPLSGFVPIGSSGFSQTTVPVGIGLHTVTASQPVGVTIYGWNEYESYGWPGCLSFGNSPGAITLQCPQDMTVRCTGANGALVTYRAFAFQGCDPIPMECTPPSGSIFPPGVTVVTCRVSQSPQGPQTCSFKVTVQCNRIEISISANKAVLAWPSGAVLESSSEIGGPWLPVADAKPPFTIEPQGAQKYFRVRE